VAAVQAISRLRRTLAALGPCAVALAPVAGADKLSGKIAAAQQRARTTADPIPILEQGRLDEATAAYQTMMDLRPDLHAYARAARWPRELRTPGSFCTPLRFCPTPSLPARQRRSGRCYCRPNENFSPRCRVTIRRLRRAVQMIVNPQPRSSHEKPQS